MEKHTQYNKNFAKFLSTILRHDINLLSTISLDRYVTEGYIQMNELIKLIYKSTYQSYANLDYISYIVKNDIDHNGISRFETTEINGILYIRSTNKRDSFFKTIFKKNTPPTSSSWHYDNQKYTPATSNSWYNDKHKYTPPTSSSWHYDNHKDTSYTSSRWNNDKHKYTPATSSSWHYDNQKYTPATSNSWNNDKHKYTPATSSSWHKDTPTTSSIRHNINDISRQLSKLLRWHINESKYKYLLDEHFKVGGYVYVDKLRVLREFNDITDNEIYYIVETDNKGRFKLETFDGKLYIRVNQGHSADVGKLINVNSLHDEIKTALSYCAHGTTSDKLQSILENGLYPMSRDGIHFASSINAKSGFRYTSNVIIHIDMEKAMDDGIKFYMSSNGVILSKSKIDPKYISNIEYL